MMHDVKMGRRVRKSFSKVNEVLSMPDLIEVQKNSYYRFLKEDLREVFNDISPIVDYSGKLVLEFVTIGSISTSPSTPRRRARKTT